MAFGTSLVTVKSALVALLTARAGLSGVTVTYGYPVSGPMKENIWFDNSESINDTPVMSDPMLDEDYRINCFLQVLRTQGEGQLDADTRAVQLLVELQELLSQNPTLGLSVIQYAELESWTHHSGPLESGLGSAGSAFEAKIHVRAILD